MTLHTAVAILAVIQAFTLLGLFLAVKDINEAFDHIKWLMEKEERRVLGGGR